MSLWLKATGKVLGRGLLELLFGVILTAIIVAVCVVIYLALQLAFQFLFWIFGDAWFTAIGNWFNAGGYLTFLWWMLGGTGLCVLILIGLEIRDTKIKMEEEAKEEDEDLAEGD